MRDVRIDRWADVMVNYSLRAEKGQRAVILGEVEAMPLVEACYEKLIQAGTIAEPIIRSTGLSEIQYKYASDEQLQTTPPVGLYAAQQCDLYLVIGAESNSKFLSGVAPERQALASQARMPIMEAILDRAAESKMRWTYTHFPSPSAAQDAEMGTREYEEFVFSLGYLNEDDPVQVWKEVQEKQQSMIDYLIEKKELHFQNAEGTDLRVDIAGMKWVNCCGLINFPDGEVYTGPNLNAADGGVNGVARFSMPTLYRNVEVHDIELKFHKGAVVEANASKGQDFLRNMIQQDEGAKFVGEIAFGTNYNMTRITKNILFDEKFGGTLHLALGKGYPETGNCNRSALHWDIIFDLRKGGSITADWEVICQDGKLLRSDWPQPKFTPCSVEFSSPS